MMINRWGRELLGYEESELLTRKWFEPACLGPRGWRKSTLFQRIVAETLHSAEHSKTRLSAGTGVSVISLGAARHSPTARAGSSAFSVPGTTSPPQEDEAALALEARHAEAMLQLPQAAEQLGEAELMQRGDGIGRNLTASGIAFIHFVHDDEETIELVAWSRRTLGYYCKAASTATIGKPGRHVGGRAARGARAVMFNDYAAYPHKHGLPEGHGEWRLISVPVIENGKVVMLTGVGNKAADYTDLDLRTVELVSDLIWRLVQRRRAVQALRESEATYRSLFDNMLNGFAYCRMLFENRGARRFHLSQRQRGLRKPDGFEERGRARSPRSFPASGRRIRNCSRFIAGWRWAASPSASMNLESLRMWFCDFCVLPEARTLRGHVNVITQRKEAEAALRSNEEKFRAIYEGSNDAIMLLTEKGFFDCNARTLRDLRDDRRDEFLSLHPAQVSPPLQPDRRDSLVPRMKGSLPLSQGSKRFEWMHRRKGGEHFPAEDALAAFDFQGTRVLQATVRDISERKRAELQLRKLAQAVEQSPESIVITDLDARDRVRQRGLPATTGYSREEVIGRNPRILQSGKTPGQTYERPVGRAEEGQAWKGEFMNRRKDGSEYVEFAIITPIRQPDGRITHYVAVKEDITEKKRLGEELDRYRHHLEELVEQRTPSLPRPRRPPRRPTGPRAPSWPT